MKKKEDRMKSRENSVWEKIAVSRSTIFFVFSFFGALIQGGGADPVPGEKALTGGEIMTVQIPKNVIIYKGEVQEFLFQIKVNEKGDVIDSPLQAGTNYNKVNVKPLQQALLKWKVFPYKEDGENIQIGFYLKILLQVSSDTGRPVMKVIQNSLQFLEASLVLSKVEELTPRTRKLLGNTHGPPVYHKVDPEGVLPPKDDD